MSVPWTIERATREKPPIFHPLAGANFRTFWGHYLRNRAAGFDPRSRRQRAVAALCSLVRPPAYAIKQWRSGRAIAASDHALASRPPVFIVGHWRSGTTHLHNILSCDPQFASITLHQTANPWSMTGPGADLTRRIMSMILPETRGMDEVSLSLDSPQEEEMALGNMNALSFYNCYYFPGNFRRHFAQSILLENLSEAQLAGFAHAYRALFRRLSHAHAGDKRILSKNPPSTARLELLRETFPGAKFIHIVRNPFDVFASTLAHFPRVMSAFAWQAFDRLDYEAITLENYGLLMRRYLAQRASLGAGELVETTYERLVAAPREEIGRIYEGLGISPGEGALEAIGAYVDSLHGYRENPHTLSRSQVARVRGEWAFALAEWRYDPPEAMHVVD